MSCAPWCRGWALAGASATTRSTSCAFAASEAAAYLLGLTPAEGVPGGGRLSVRLRAEDDIAVTVMTEAPVPMWPPPAQRTLAWRILAGLVDQVSFVLEEGCPAIRLVLAGPARESVTES